MANKWSTPWPHLILLTFFRLLLIHCAKIPQEPLVNADQSFSHVNIRRFWPERSNSIRDYFFPRSLLWGKKNSAPPDVTWKAMQDDKAALTYDEQRFLSNLLLASAMYQAKPANPIETMQSNRKREARKTRANKSRCQLNLGLSNGCVFQEAIEGDMFKKYLTSVEGPG